MTRYEWVLLAWLVTGVLCWTVALTVVGWRL